MCCFVTQCNVLSKCFEIAVRLRLQLPPGCPCADPVHTVAELCWVEAVCMLSFWVWTLLTPLPSPFFHDLDNTQLQYVSSRRDDNVLESNMFFLQPALPKTKSNYLAPIALKLVKMSEWKSDGWSSFSDEPDLMCWLSNVVWAWSSPIILSDVCLKNLRVCQDWWWFLVTWLSCSVSFVVLHLTLDVARHSPQLEVVGLKKKLYRCAKLFFVGS